MLALASQLLPASGDFASVTDVAVSARSLLVIASAVVRSLSPQERSNFDCIAETERKQTRHCYCFVIPVVCVLSWGAAGYEVAVVAAAVAAVFGGKTVAPARSLRWVVHYLCCCWIGAHLAFLPTAVGPGDRSKNDKGDAANQQVAQWLRKHLMKIGDLYQTAKWITKNELLGLPWVSLRCLLWVVGSADEIEARKNAPSDL